MDIQKPDTEMSRKDSQALSKANCITILDAFKGAANHHRGQLSALRQLPLPLPLSTPTANPPALAVATPPFISCQLSIVSCHLAASCGLLMRCVAMRRASE